MSRPHFSLITPVYNRAGFIRRAIDSCLAQTFKDFELIVVDDASTDGSAEAVAAAGDDRIILLRHTGNRGPCPARNAAIDRARGMWCVMVDSDFALKRDALEKLANWTHAAEPDVGNVATSCQWDTGLVSPAPPGAAETLDYRAFMKWLAGVRVSEKLECVRREALWDTRYPNSRAWEFEFHLDLAKRWKIEIRPEVLVKVYSDAPNRLTTATDRSAVARVLRDASDKLESYERILRNHGDTMRAEAPTLYRYTLALASLQAFLFGDRNKGYRLLGTGLKAGQGLGTLIGTGVLGTVGKRATAWATVIRRRVLS